MTDRDRGRMTKASLAACAAAALLLGGCGGNRTAASNVVEMRDMEVVDGTVNDDMTDLDAVRTNGVGLSENASNASSAAAKTAPRTPSAGATNAEAVPSE